MILTFKELQAKQAQNTKGENKGRKKVLLKKDSRVDEHILETAGLNSPISDQ